MQTPILTAISHGSQIFLTICKIFDQRFFSENISPDFGIGISFAFLTRYSNEFLSDFARFRSIFSHDFARISRDRMRFARISNAIPTIPNVLFSRFAKYSQNFYENISPDLQNIFRDFSPKIFSEFLSHFARIAIRTHFSRTICKDLSGSNAFSRIRARIAFSFTTQRRPFRTIGFRSEFLHDLQNILRDFSPFSKYSHRISYDFSRFRTDRIHFDSDRTRLFIGDLSQRSKSPETVFSHDLQNILRIFVIFREISDSTISRFRCSRVRMPRLRTICKIFSRKTSVHSDRTHFARISHGFSLTICKIFSGFRTISLEFSPRFAKYSRRFRKIFSEFLSDFARIRNDSNANFARFCTDRTRFVHEISNAIPTHSNVLFRNDLQNILRISPQNISSRFRQNIFGRRHRFENFPRDGSMRSRTHSDAFDFVRFAKYSQNGSRISHDRTHSCTPISTTI